MRDCCPALRVSRSVMQLALWIFRLYIDARDDSRSLIARRRRSSVARGVTAKKSDYVCPPSAALSGRLPRRWIDARCWWRAPTAYYEREPHRQFPTVISRFASCPPAAHSGRRRKRVIWFIEFYRAPIDLDAVCAVRAYHVIIEFWDKDTGERRGNNTFWGSP